MLNEPAFKYGETAPVDLNAIDYTSDYTASTNYVNVSNYVMNL